jgi:hypothetical protein
MLALLVPLFALCAHMRCFALPSERASSNSYFNFRCRAFSFNL